MWTKRCCKNAIISISQNRCILKFALLCPNLHQVGLFAALLQVSQIFEPGEAEEDRSSLQNDFSHHSPVLVPKTKWPVISFHYILYINITQLWRKQMHLEWMWNGLQWLVLPWYTWYYMRSVLCTYLFKCKVNLFIELHLDWISSLDFSYIFSGTACRIDCKSSALQKMLY